MSGFRTSRRTRLEKEESKNRARDEGEGWANFFKGEERKCAHLFLIFGFLYKLDLKRKLNFLNLIMWSSFFSSKDD